MAEQYDIRTQWLMDGTAVPAPVNQFMFYGGASLMAGDPSWECYMVVGHASPLIGEPDPTGPNVIPIVPVGSFSFSLGRLRELHSVLGQFLAQQDQVEQSAHSPR